MNITLSDKEYRLICIAMSYLSSNIDAFDEEEEPVNENEVVELRERVNSLGRT